MDPDPDPRNDLSQLSPREIEALSHQFEAEMQKSRIQEVVHVLTSTCFKTCVTNNGGKGSVKRITSEKLDRGEETCAQNCVDRFLDLNSAILRDLRELRGGRG